MRVLTKNHEVENDFDLIRKYRDRVIVGLSITATPDKSKIMQVVEINASPIKETKKADTSNLTYCGYDPAGIERMLNGDR